MNNKPTEHEKLFIDALIDVLRQNRIIIKSKAGAHTGNFVESCFVYYDNCVDITLSNLFANSYFRIRIEEVKHEDFLIAENNMLRKELDEKQKIIDNTKDTKDTM